ncbi:TOMM precursor leader peptide-binding protein [Pengzhenrongella phosphoraccumulans]|uniref:TOMM precursor leader peptide-binding protein n=1 Tax=Pengzhenrongella phosphoraccumulans TaxID=3114394 RepID=UPI00388E585C
MAEVHVRVVGASALAEQLRALLSFCSQESGPLGGESTDSSLTIVVLEDDDELPVDLVDAVWQDGGQLLRVMLTRGRVRVGPYVRRGSTACLECLTATETEVPPRPAPTDPGVTTQIAAALSARQVYALLSRSLPSHLPLHIRQTDTETFELVEYTAATRPGCPRCSARVLEQPRPAPLSAVYEAAVAIPPREFADLKGHQNHYKPGNLSLQRKFRTWPTCPHLPLTAPALDRLAVPWARATEPSASAAVTEAEVSILLKISVGLQGITEQRVLRWTAAGGNIGSAHAYLIVRDCEGIKPGLYAYLEEKHELAQLVGSVDGLGGDSPVTVVMTGDVGKVAQKYGPFGLRVTLQDGGCSLASLAIAGNALGIGIRTRNAWDTDKIMGALTIGPDSELVTSVTDLVRAR